ncbi:DNA cytosine methyltransferase, partial [bacterium]|nr:DNA cytosine methyltransferase [bacterium]
HVFVMENVKGILSSKVGGQQIFHSILEDLAGCGYRIHSLVTETSFVHGDNPAKLDARDFIVHAERYGVPQARHRVILLGIREDVFDSQVPGWKPPVLLQKPTVSVIEAIHDLPPLRSRISKAEDSAERWKLLLMKNCRDLAVQARLKKHNLDCVADTLDKVVAEGGFPVSTGEDSNKYHPPRHCTKELSAWYTAQGATTNKLRYILNHEARGHMESDLRRYVYAAAFSKATGSSPKGHEEFALKGLAPDHVNWKSGKFADRFRVQLAGRPSTTITSHISKDGHYFIHYDPVQCRSLTVREAARLQTFPDDYFFQGKRTQQYHQVGNAVPPYLARQIADIAFAILKSMDFP